MMRPIIPVATLLLAGCSGDLDEGTAPPTGPVPTMAMASPSGDGQLATPGTPLEPFRVQIRQGTTPLPGRSVSWLFTQGGGTLSQTTSTTDAGGIATTQLTLGGQPGVVEVRASAGGVTGSPVSFTAIGTVPGQYVVVNVVNNEFQPASVTIAGGGKVLFLWEADSDLHNILPVPPNPIPEHADPESGAHTYEVTFPTAGTFDYFCSIHGTATSGMRGRVIVQ